MPKLSEQEALALVAVRGHCDDSADWRCDAAHNLVWEISSGVQDELGSRRGQYIHLHVTQSRLRAHDHRLLFTLFRKDGDVQQRVYQLELLKGTRRQRGWHNRSHEHIGSARREERADWESWDFGAALAHFCQRTNIYFSPIPPDPLLSSKEKEHAHRHH